MKNLTATMIFIALASLARCAPYNHITPSNNTPKTYLTPSLLSDPQRKLYEKQLRQRKKLENLYDVKTLLRDILYQTGQRENIDEALFDIMTRPKFEALFDEEDRKRSLEVYGFEIPGGFYRPSEHRNGESVTLPKASIRGGLNAIFHELGHKFGGITRNRVINELRAMAYQGFAIQLTNEMYPEFYSTYALSQSMDASPRAKVHFPAFLLYYEVYKRFGNAEATWAFVKEADEDKIRKLLELISKKGTAFPFFINEAFYSDQKEFDFGLKLNTEKLLEMFNNNMALYEALTYEQADSRGLPRDRVAFFNLSPSLFTEHFQYQAFMVAGALYESRPKEALDILHRIRSRCLHDERFYMLIDTARYRWEVHVCEDKFPPGDNHDTEGLKKCKLHYLMLFASIDLLMHHWQRPNPRSALPLLEEALKIQDSAEARMILQYAKQLPKTGSVEDKDNLADPKKLNDFIRWHIFYTASHWDGSSRIVNREKGNERIFSWLDLWMQYRRLTTPNPDDLKKEYETHVGGMEKYEEPVWTNGEFVSVMLYRNSDLRKKCDLEESIATAYLERDNLEDALKWYKKTKKTRRSYHSEIWIEYLEAKLDIKKPE